ncbi:MAG: hypothetical protein ABSF26_29020 [Thermoguttaceae bacterium]
MKNVTTARAEMQPVPRPIRIFFSAGEPSGDLHAANLIAELRRRCADFEAVGYGGPRMAAAGGRLQADLTRLAVMWFARAVANLPRFWDLVSRADRYFRHHRPDAVVLVDYPGFNWWIARRAKVHRIPVFYYTPPQIWAWATWRAEKMRRLTDHVLCSLPFEEEWLRRRGCNATFVGHPFFDQVRNERPDQAFLADWRRRPGPLVTILPGSRTQEVSHNLPGLLKAAVAIRRAVPQVRLAVAAFQPRQAEMARRMAAAAGWTLGNGIGDWGLGIGGAASGGGEGEDAGTRGRGDAETRTLEIHSGKTPELMQLADCTMACSGSVSLELLYYTKPTVILYQISRPAYALQRHFRKVKYITLVNLLATGELYPADLSPYDPSQPGAEQVPFPEYLTCADRSERIAAHVIEWLRDPVSRAARVAELEQLKARVAHAGASARAADYILDALNH